MNKQRKVLITITYNEMGIIIDTKAEELGSSAQSEPFGAIKHAGEHPLSDSEIIPRLRQIQEQVGGSYAIDRVIELLTAQHIDADGTLWITVTDIERVKRVIVDEEKSTFCRQFYMDAQPEQHWIPVTVRLPEEDDYRPCCGYEDGAVWWRNDMGLMGLGWYYPSTGKWAYYDESDRCEKCVGNVVEWMQLPKREGDAE